MSEQQMAMATQLSAGQILCLSADDRALFVQQNLSDNTQDGSLNIQNITGWDGLSETKRALLGRELLQAVTRVTAPSIDVTALVALLGQIPPESKHRTTQSYCPSPTRSSTVEPPEDEEREYEIKCHQALLDDGFRPLFHVGLLPQIEANPDAYTHLLRPWARQQQHAADAKGAWQALSRQWNRWKEFRAWQLRGRRRRPGFDEYFDAHRRDYFMSGGTSRGAAEADFEQTARLCWGREYDYEDEEDVERHAERLGRWLVQQEFVLRRPFSLLADPKGQDQWTTYVEYLAFEVESLHGLAEAARRLEKRAKIRDGCKGKHQAAKAAAEQQQSRVGWVLSEIEKIEAEQEAAAGESGGSSRKHTDDTNRPEDVLEPRLGKRRRTKKVEEMDKTGETEKMPAGKSDSSSQTRRSKRRKPSTEADEKEEDVPEPQSKRRKVVGTSDGPSSIPQPQALDPRAPAVSVGTTTAQTPPPGRLRRSKRLDAPFGTATAAGAPPDASGERLRSPRPRVNVKLATVSTDPRHGGARRPGGRLRAAARSIS